MLPARVGEEEKEERPVDPPGEEAPPDPQSAQEKGQHMKLQLT